MITGGTGSTPGTSGAGAAGAKGGDGGLGVDCPQARHGNADDPQQRADQRRQWRRRFGRHSERRERPRRRRHSDATRWHDHDQRRDQRRPERRRRHARQRDHVPVGRAHPDAPDRRDLRRQRRGRHRRNQQCGRVGQQYACSRWRRNGHDIAAAIPEFRTSHADQRKRRHLDAHRRRGRHARYDGVRRNDGARRGSRADVAERQSPDRRHALALDGRACQRRAEYQRRHIAGDRNSAELSPEHDRIRRERRDVRYRGGREHVQHQPGACRRRLADQDRRGHAGADRRQHLFGRHDDQRRDIAARQWRNNRLGRRQHSQQRDTRVQPFERTDVRRCDLRHGRCAAERRRNDHPDGQQHLHRRHDDQRRNVAARQWRDGRFDCGQCSQQRGARLQPLRCRHLRRRDLRHRRVAAERCGFDQPHRYEYLYRRNHGECRHAAGERLDRHLERRDGESRRHARRHRRAAEDHDQWRHALARQFDRHDLDRRQPLIRRRRQLHRRGVAGERRPHQRDRRSRNCIARRHADRGGHWRQLHDRHAATPCSTRPAASAARSATSRSPATSAPHGRTSNTTRTMSIWCSIRARSRRSSSAARRTSARSRARSIRRCWRATRPRRSWRCSGSPPRSFPARSISSPAKCTSRPRACCADESRYMRDAVLGRLRQASYGGNASMASLSVGGPVAAFADGELDSALAYGKSPIVTKAPRMVCAELRRDVLGAGLRRARPLRDRRQCRDGAARSRGLHLGRRYPRRRQRPPRRRGRLHRLEERARRARHGRCRDRAHRRLRRLEFRRVQPARRRRLCVPLDRDRSADRVPGLLRPHDRELRRPHRTDLRRARLRLRVRQCRDRAVRRRRVGAGQDRCGGGARRACGAQRRGHDVRDRLRDARHPRRRA